MLPIDIRQLIASRTPKNRQQNRLPAQLVRWLEKITSLHEINNCLAYVGDKQGADFVQATLEYLEVDVCIHGEERLEGLKRPMLVSNHPLGGLDGLVLLSLLSRHYPQVRLMVNDFLMALSPLGEFFVPVNKLGTNRQHVQRYHELFSGDAAIIHFPAGLCSRRKGDRLRDLAWNRSYVRLCRNSGRSIVPCFFAGENSRFFYTLANIRRWFHIGFNIEMLLLATEMFRQRGKTLAAYIGTPITPRQLQLGEGNVDSQNQNIRQQVYALLTQARQEKMSS